MPLQLLPSALLLTGGPAQLLHSAALLLHCVSGSHGGCPCCPCCRACSAYCAATSCSSASDACAVQVHVIPVRYCAAQQRYMLVQYGLLHEVCELRPWQEQAEAMQCCNFMNPQLCGHGAVPTSTSCCLPKLLVDWTRPMRRMLLRPSTLHHSYAMILLMLSTCHTLIAAVRSLTALSYKSLAQKAKIEPALSI